MYVTLKGTLPTTIIVTYLPAAERPMEEKEKAYKHLQNIVFLIQWIYLIIPYVFASTTQYDRSVGG